MRSDLTLLRVFVGDHAGHNLSFEEQTYIECVDCGETHLLPDGAGVDILSPTQVKIEIPTGTGHLSCFVYPKSGRVEV